jgi:hypothetical protein
MSSININPIHNFDDFVSELNKAGMSIGGENSEGIFTLCNHFSDNIDWHTENPETDPWEWRMRVLNERDDIAYAKLFFKKSGYITKDWYPYFYAVRRGGRVLDEEYYEGKISSYAKNIYGLIRDNINLPLHMIKQMGGFTKEDKSKFDAALTELQMKMYITMCGKTRKLSKIGAEYGWSSTVFCITENLFDAEVYELAGDITYEEAYQKIEEQIYLLNPEANEKKVRKFILG